MIAFLRRRWLPIALLVSLGGNLFFTGFLFGRPPRHGPPPGPERFVERMAENLAPADAEVLRRAMAPQRDALLAEHRDRHEFPDKLAAALTAEPFDPQALAEVFADQDRKEAESHRRLARTLVAAAAQMSPEGRRRIATFRP